MNIDDEIETIIDELNDSPAMDPAKASQEDSLEFLDGVIERIMDIANTIRTEMFDL